MADQAYRLPADRSPGHVERLVIKAVNRAGGAAIFRAKGTAAHRMAMKVAHRLPKGWEASITPEPGTGSGAESSWVLAVRNSDAPMLQMVGYWPGSDQPLP